MISSKAHQILFDWEMRESWNYRSLIQEQYLFPYSAAVTDRRRGWQMYKTSSSKTPNCLSPSDRTMRKSLCFWNSLQGPAVSVITVSISKRQTHAAQPWVPVKPLSTAATSINFFDVASRLLAYFQESCRVSGDVRGFDQGSPSLAPTRTCHRFLKRACEIFCFFFWRSPPSCVSTAAPAYIRKSSRLSSVFGCIATATE